MWRFLLALLLAIKWRREAWLRTTLPVPVILKRLATDLRVLLRAIDFGIGKGVGDYQAVSRMQSVFRFFYDCAMLNIHVSLHREEHDITIVMTNCQ
jgi:hypothetical protein